MVLDENTVEEVKIKAAEDKIHRRKS